MVEVVRLWYKLERYVMEEGMNRGNCMEISEAGARTYLGVWVCGLWVVGRGLWVVGCGLLGCCLEER